MKLYYKIVKNFGKDEGKGFTALMFKRGDNMCQGVTGNFKTEQDGHDWAKASGYKPTEQMYESH